MRVLITGARGQLGTECTRVLRPHYDVIPLSSAELDITNLIQVSERIKEQRPHVVINCAAYTKVDDCEVNAERADRVNHIGPKNLAMVCKEAGSRLIHISTDYVFDGTRPPPEGYHEGDTPCPISVYGQSKLRGEVAVLDTWEDSLVIRTSWVYGSTGHNFLKTILRLCLGGKVPLKVVDDQYGSPTWAYGLALQIRALLDSSVKGIVHATGQGYTTWYGFARYFLGLMEVPCSITPCTTEEYPTMAKRPPNSILEPRILNSLGLLVMRDWKEDLKDWVKEAREGLIREVRGYNERI